MLRWSRHLAIVIIFSLMLPTMSKRQLIRSLRLFCVDFDLTLTQVDTTMMLPSLPRRGESSQQSLERGLRWDGLVNAYMSDWQASAPEWTTPSPSCVPGANSSAGASNGSSASSRYYAAIRAAERVCALQGLVERRSIERVEASSVLAGLWREDVRAAAADVPLQQDALRVLRRISHEHGVPLAVVSVNWSRDVIVGAVGQDMPYDVYCNDAVFAPMSATEETSGSVNGAACPDISTGMLSKAIVDAFDKRSCLRRLVQRQGGRPATAAKGPHWSHDKLCENGAPGMVGVAAAGTAKSSSSQNGADSPAVAPLEGAGAVSSLHHLTGKKVDPATGMSKSSNGHPGHGKMAEAQPPGLTVYVGDSFTDILALLDADVGIVIGCSSSLRKMCGECGIELASIAALPGALRDTTAEDAQGHGPPRHKVGPQGGALLYCAGNWLEIEQCLLS
eukprot:jgi/Mesvir1/15358/Mv06561-RA.1